jgi:hypothetical protein
MQLNLHTAHHFSRTVDAPLGARAREVLNTALFVTWISK